MIELGDGKQVIVSSDKGRLRLQINAHRGSLGVELTRAQAIKIRSALLAAVLKAESAMLLG